MGALLLFSIKKHVSVIVSIDQSINFQNRDAVVFTYLTLKSFFKGELQRKSKLISFERAFKMLKNDMYITGMGQAVLELF